MDFSHRNDRVRWLRVSIIGGLITVIAVTVFAVFCSPPVSREAGIYEETGRQLIRNTTEGRQAVISSLWWPPLATLVRIPLLPLFPDDGFIWASVCISAISGFFLVSFLWRFSITLAGGVRTALVCLMLAVAPFFLKVLVNGSNALLIGLLTVICADNMARWLVGRSVRALVYFAASSALLCGLSPELAVWVGAMLIFFIADIIHSRSMSRKHKEAAVILGLLPAVYTLSLWFLMNWLIMGDALYFLKPLWKAGFLPTIEGEGMARLGLLHLACGLIPAFTAGISAGSRNRTGILWSAFALLLFLTALLFRHVGMLWEDTAILSVMPVFVFFTAVAAMGHIEGGVVAGWRRLLILIPAVLLFLSFEQLPDKTLPKDDAVHLSVIERHVMSRSRYAKVFVCGYDSFDILHGSRSRVFEHAMDFNLNKVKKDYRGHDLFVMIKKPAGRGSGDSVHWKYRDIYSLGSEEMLYDADWGNWRLFQVIQPSRREE